MVALACCLSLLPAAACKYNVRDVGFVDWAPQPYHLYCYLDGDPSSGFATTLRNTAAALFLDANVELQIVDASQKPKPDALRFAETEHLNTFPALVLVSPDQERLTLPLPQTTDQVNTAAWEVLENVISSPARQTLFRRIIEAYALVVILEGTDPTENEHNRASVNQAIERLTRLMDRLPKAVKGPPEALIIPQTQAEQERVFLWSLGIQPAKSKTAHVAVLYGRGRKIGPTLSGRVSQDAVYQTLAVLGQDCECSLDRSWMTGPMIPAEWGTDLQTQVQEHAGFDAENPLVKTEISRIMARGPSSNIRPVGLPDHGTFDLDTFGYNEISVDELSQTPADVPPEPIDSTTDPISPLPRPAPAAATPPSPSSNLNSTLATLAGITLFVIGTCAIMFWRIRTNP